MAKFTGIKKEIYNKTGYEAATMACPFSWVESIKPKEYFSLLFEEKAMAEVRSEPCLQTRCKFFDATARQCRLIAAD